MSIELKPVNVGDPIVWFIHCHAVDMSRLVDDPQKLFTEKFHSYECLLKPNDDVDEHYNMLMTDRDVYVPTNQLGVLCDLNEETYTWLSKTGVFTVNHNKHQKFLWQCSLDNNRVIFVHADDVEKVTACKENFVEPRFLGRTKAA